MSDKEDHEDKGAIERKCSKCKRPCRGHMGPYGSSCTAEYFEDSASGISKSTVPSDDTVDTNPDCNETSGLLVQQMTALVQQMAALNVYIEGVIQGQDNIQHKLSDTRPNNTPPDIDADTTSHQNASTSGKTTLLPNGVRIPEKVSKLAVNDTSDLDSLRATAHQLVQSGIRQSTRRTYTSAQNNYIDFCIKYQLIPVPCNEETLLLFISYLYKNNLKGSSIRVYLSAVRSLHVEEGYGNPLQDYLRVKQALRALDVLTDKPKKKLAITLDIMASLYSLIDHTVENKMMWAAFILSFFGCLRASEVVAKSVFDPMVNLCQNDVQFSGTGPDVIMTVRIKTSKTDKFNKGFDVVISCVPHLACAVCAMKSYMNANKWNDDHQPLFQTSKGILLTKSLFQKQLSLYMSMLGYPSHQYSGHSFRSGCATAAAAAGLMDWEIKLLGRWASDAYQGYIRAPKQLLANFSKRIVNNTNNHQHYNHYVLNAFSS